MSTVKAERRRWRDTKPAASERWPLGSPMEIRYRACSLGAPHAGRVERSAVRLLNVLVAVVGIVITAPLMLMVALAVATTSPGPVIFKQRRVGLNRRTRLRSGPPLCRRQDDHGGRIFTIYKFRTMRSDAPAEGEVWATRDDARVTRVGRVLRATRLDEVPQFFNVLKGDMNIVGPRPEQPSIFKSLATEVRDYARRQGVLPGITGLAQIELGYDTDLEAARKKVELDLEYIRRRSAVRDLAIMAKTIPVMVFRKVWM